MGFLRVGINSLPFGFSHFFYWRFSELSDFMMKAARCALASLKRATLHQRKASEGELALKIHNKNEKRDEVEVLRVPLKTLLRHKVVGIVTTHDGQAAALH